MSTDKDQDKLSFQGWDGTPGDEWERFDLRLMNNSAKSDDRGWSYADHYKGLDEGGPAGPPFPANCVWCMWSHAFTGTASRWDG